MNRKEAFKEINNIQNYYIDELVSIINNSAYTNMKIINFTSATGTGKTKMMGKLINKFPNYFFIITSLSKGQLYLQIKENIKKDCKNSNFIVYGTADYRINSKLQVNDIIESIPKGKKCIWIRDEGHIRTNKFDEILIDICYKVINFSATNIYSDVQCNFTQTMMLRTVNQASGTPEEAIQKLLEIKQYHKKIHNYNPCAIFRCVSGDKYLYKNIITLCEKNNLKYIDITEDSFVMSELCEDDNEYDVIINKFKLVEGIDIRRAHVLYMDNQPTNNITTIQAIGRCRRNALLYRTDVDIFAPENVDLLKNTRECYVFYNIKEMKMPTDTEGELQYAFCNYVSCESLKVGTTIEVVDGQLPNGLYVIELNGKTGRFKISTDVSTGFNIVEPLTDFYDKIITHIDDNFIYINKEKKIHIDNIPLLPICNSKKYFDTSINKFVEVSVEPYYNLCLSEYKNNIFCRVPLNILNYYKTKIEKYTSEYILEKVKNKCSDVLIKKVSYSLPTMKKTISDYLGKKKKSKDAIQFSQFILDIPNLRSYIDGFEYKMSELFSEEEIIIISYFCINKKVNKISNECIKLFLKNFVELRSQYNHINYSSEYQLSNIFKNLILQSLSISDIKQVVNEFLENDNSIIEDNEFYQLIFNITAQENQKEKNIFYKLQKCCTDEELLFIQYCCIKEKEIFMQNGEIKNYIKKIIKSRFNFNKYRKTLESPLITYLLLNRDLPQLTNNVRLKPFIVNVIYPELESVSIKDIDLFFSKIEEKFTNLDKEFSNYLFVNSKVVVNNIIENFSIIEQELKSNILHIVHYSYESLYEDMTDNEKFLLRNGYMELGETRIPANSIHQMKEHVSYDKIYNDKESAIIGVDLMHQINNDYNKPIWVESKSISSKVNNFNKLNLFISDKYKNELECAKPQLVSGKNNFKLDKQCNSIIGYCVEYYSKYIVFGESYLEKFIQKAQRELSTNIINDYVIIRACMLKYKKMMVKCFGIGISRVIRGISIDKLTQDEYKYFISLVVKLGTRTAEYVKAVLYTNQLPKDNIDSNLSIMHIAGLADYITEDTILDVKVRNNIDEKCIRQVLAYHYLSTKRSDLNIKRVIVYDAVSEKSVVVNICDKNIKNRYI